VTKRGAALAPRAIAAVEEVDARFFADIPEKDALRFLRRLVQEREQDAAPKGKDSHTRR
jgi:hypothetical protein